VKRPQKLAGRRSLVGCAKAAYFLPGLKVCLASGAAVSMSSSGLLKISTGFLKKLRSASRTRPKGSVPASHFEAKYRADIDPWGFRNSQYDQQKYQATLDALSRRRYHQALELGCGIGTLSRLLAARCDRLLALDASQTAIAEAKRQNLANVDFEAAYLPSDFPTGRFDLIALSEILYYFSATDLKIVAQRCVDALDQGGEMILCHYLGETDNPLTGAEASDLFAAVVSARLPLRTTLKVRTRLKVRTTLKEREYQLERLSAQMPRAKIV